MNGNRVWVSILYLVFEVSSEEGDVETLCEREGRPRHEEEHARDVVNHCQNGRNYLLDDPTPNPLHFSVPLPASVPFRSSDLPWLCILHSRPVSLKQNLCFALMLLRKFAYELNFDRVNQ